MSGQQTLFAERLTDNERLDREFFEFDAKHPDVWQLYVSFAIELYKAGRRRGSSEQIMQRIRWESDINPQRKGGFKISNIHRARYARKLANSDPRFANFFSFRDGNNGVDDNEN